MKVHLTKDRWTNVIGSFLWLILTLFALVRLVPRFSEVYVQVKIQLPPMTKILLGLSRLFEGHLWIGVVLLILLPTASGLFRGRWARFASFLLLVGGCGTWAWMMVALFLPLIGELEGIHSIKK